MRSNSAEFWMTPILQYLLITLNASKFENSLFVIRKILGLFCNTLTAGQKYSLLNRDNLMQHTQTQLSLKKKNFYGFFSPFLTLRFYFQHIQKKHDPHSWCIFEVTDSENHGLIHVSKVLFLKTFRTATW